MPEISVIIPCYNLAKHLTESVRSVLQQTVVEWECIIINDGSTDETEAVALSLVKEDQRIRYLEQTNKGLAAARNRGLDTATGRYIQFLDADDWISPAKFEAQLAVLKTTPDLSLSYCDYERHVDDPKRTAPYSEVFSPNLDQKRALLDLASRWETELSIPPHCFLFDARFFTERNIWFDETLPNHEDWDCWMQILATDPRIFRVPAALATYRYRPDSMSADLRQMRKGFLKAVRKQQRVFRENKEVDNALCEKFRSVKNEYRDFTWPRLAYAHARELTGAALRAVLPVGMRRALRSLVS